MRFVNYLGDPVNIPARSLSDQTPTRAPGQLVINHVGPKRDPAPGIIDYRGIEPEIELDGVLPVRADWGKFKFLVDGEMVIAEYATLERLGTVHYKITALESVDPHDSDLDEPGFIALLEREANRHAEWLNSIVTSDGASPPEVQYWGDQYTADGSRQMVFLVNGQEVIADCVPETFADQIYDLPKNILNNDADLPLPASDLLVLMRQAVIQQINAFSAVELNNEKDPPF